MIETENPQSLFKSLITFVKTIPMSWIVGYVGLCLSIMAIEYSLLNNIIIAYGDSESHLNIAKRVVDSITPGFAQLGGIWLPLPHLLMVPLVKFEFLYRSGLAGSIISGISFIIAGVYIYKLTAFLTKSRFAAFMAFLVFGTNPNILYLQSTPMTELLLICFFILSTYYFVRFLAIRLDIHQLVDLTPQEKNKEVLFLLLAAFYGFCATISRYDGWFLVLVEAAIIFVLYLPYQRFWYLLKNEIGKLFGLMFKKNITLVNHHHFKKLQGLLILYSVLAFLGIFIWLSWNGLIFNDPLYFTNSPFSAKSQQQGWMGRGELPAYHNLPLSFEYYLYTSAINVGFIIFAISALGFIILFLRTSPIFAIVFSAILLVPFIFNLITLYLGQSVIFIPPITPENFTWRLFNVRYGTLMVPAAAVLFGLVLYYVKNYFKILLIGLLFIQIGLYFTGQAQAVSLIDGTVGLSAAKKPDAEYWMADNYDGGLVLMDDFSRSMSVIRSNVPMQNMIYIGNKPYWEKALKEPEKEVRWIVMQKDDPVWKSLYENPERQGHLFKYFNKAYTSPDILVFKRMDTTAALDN